MERSRYAKFCGDLDAVQDAVSQAYGDQLVAQSLQNPTNRKSSEEIYREIVGGETQNKNGNLVEISDHANIGIDLPEYGNNKWYVDVTTGEVYLLNGFIYEGKAYTSKKDIQNGGNKIPLTLEVGDYVKYEPDEGDTTALWRVWEIDRPHEKVIIVPTQPLGSVTLEGVTGENGWVNAEKNITVECQKYVSDALNVTQNDIRSLKLEDIENAMQNEKEYKQAFNEWRAAKGDMRPLGTEFEYSSGTFYAKLAENNEDTFDGKNRKVVNGIEVTETNKIKLAMTAYHDTTIPMEWKRLNNSKAEMKNDTFGTLLNYTKNSWLASCCLDCTVGSTGYCTFFINAATRSLTYTAAGATYSVIPMISLDASLFYAGGSGISTDAWQLAR